MSTKKIEVTAEQAMFVIDEDGTRHGPITGVHIQSWNTGLNSTDCEIVLYDLSLETLASLHLFKEAMDPAIGIRVLYERESYGIDWQKPWMGGLKQW